jgi:hypothetical protein
VSPGNSGRNQVPRNYCMPGGALNGMESFLLCASRHLSELVHGLMSNITLTVSASFASGSAG